MAAVDETPTGIRVSDPRPLPSVGIPLLREERRAARVRTIVLALAGVLLVGLGVGGTLLVQGLLSAPDEPVSLVVPSLGGGAPPPAARAPDEVAADGGTAATGAPAEAAPREPDPLPVIAQPPTVEGAVRRTEHRFGKARSFREALLAATITRDEAPALETALSQVLDFRRCHPEDRLVVERDAASALAVFEYHGSLTEYVDVRPDARGTLVASRVERPVERVRIARGGLVRTSLGDALDAEGLGRTVTGAFVEAFEGRANFTTQARTGDVFRIVVDEERVDGTLLRFGAAHALEYHGSRTGRLRAFWFEPREGRGDFYDETGREVHGGWLRTPVRYDSITSRFNPRRMHPILRRIVPHNGVDYAAASGTLVVAAADGVVTWAGDKGPNGNLVSIRHDDGYETHYAHLSRFERGIAVGSTVRQRQPIGYVGSTGRSTGPHLHFGLARHGRFVDPLPIINGPGRMLPGGQLARFRARMRELDAELAGIEIAGGAAPAPEPAAAGEPDAPEPEQVLD